MITAITRAVRYSARPCPKGCFLSAGLLASFVPTIVITEDSTSLRLFTESIMIAIEFVIKPTTTLNIERKIFAAIPIMLVLTIMLSRLSFFITSCHP